MFHVFQIIVNKFDYLQNSIFSKSTAVAAPRFLISVRSPTFFHSSPSNSRISVLGPENPPAWIFVSSIKTETKLTHDIKLVVKTCKTVTN